MFMWNPSSYSTPLEKPMRNGTKRSSEVSSIPDTVAKRSPLSPVKREPSDTTQFMRSINSSPLFEPQIPPLRSGGLSPSPPDRSPVALTRPAPTSLLAPRSEDDYDHGPSPRVESDRLGLPAVSQEKADLEHASSCITGCVSKDLAKLDIADQLCATTNGVVQIPSASGAHPDDYVVSDVPHFRIAQEYQISDSIIQAMTENTSGFTAMGAFPDLKMAWATVDTKLHIWPWDSPKKITMINFPEFVTSVGLLPTWSPDLMHLESLFVIVTATITEVLFSGVKAVGSSFAIDPDKFVLRASTNDQRFIKMQCTKQGRVFLGSTDGQMHELQNIKQTIWTKWFWCEPRIVNCTMAVYERIASAVPGFGLFFRKEPIVQMVLDEGRKFIYTLRKDNDVDLYDLGIDGNSGVRHIHLSFSTIVNQALPLLRNVDRLQIRQVISVNPVGVWESTLYPFFLLTSAGLRLYFSVTPRNGSSDRPREFLLGHIRFPPGHNPSAPLSTISAHSTVTDSLHIDGTVMMVTPNDQEDQDDLVSSTNDLYIYEEKYRESVSITSIPFHVEAISQLPQHSDDSLVAGSRSYTFNQLMSSRKALMVVTARKCYLLEKSYPVDILEKLLRMYSPMSPQMREFVEYLPPFQSCFLALHLACITNSSEISRLATRLLRVYGGEPSFSSDVTAVGRNLTMVQRSINPSPDIVYSAKHDAFFYLVARTVGPLWNVHPFVFGAEYKGAIAWISGIPSGDIPLFVDQLTYIKRYLESNWNELFYPGRAVSRHGMPTEDAVTAMSATQMEMASIKSLANLMDSTIQLLRLWDFLLGEGITQVLEYVGHAYSKETLMQVVFPDLLVTTTGKSLVDAVIKAIHQRYVDEGTDIESILRVSESIRELCPKLFDADDAITMKVITMIDKARATAETPGSLTMLDTALAFIRPKATIMGLSEILDRLTENGFYEAAVELCTLAAVQSDPQNLAILHMINNELSTDSTGKTALDQRKKYYATITKILSDLDNMASSARPSAAGGSQYLKPAEARSKLEYVLDWIYTQSSDSLLHFAVFEWCLSMQLDRYALASGSPYLKDFLYRKLASLPPTDLEGIVRNYKLIAECAERSGDKFTAAQALYKLAVHETAQIPISERVDFLARIGFLCQTLGLRGSAPEVAEFLNLARTHYMLANVQKDVLAHLAEKRFDTSVPPESLNRLNYELLDATKIFQLGGDADLPQWCLVVLSICGEPPNPRLIIHLWGRLLQIAVEYSKNRRISREVCISLIAEEIARVRSHLSSTDQYCALDYVLEGFEKKFASMGQLALEDLTLAFDSVIQGTGQDITDVIDVYHKLFQKYTADPVLAPHLLQIHAFIINSVMDNTLKKPLDRNRRRLILSNYVRLFDNYLKSAMRLQLTDEDVLVELQRTEKRLVSYNSNGR